MSESNADRFVFRVDASIEIGTGHVMRCLSLAHELQRQGAEVAFICRELPGNLIDRIRSNGIDVEVLPRTQQLQPEGPPTHAAWAQVTWECDAQETSSVLRKLEPEWLVVDHYAFDARWENQVRLPGMRIMAIDDLADRPHDCDLLLDQNLGRQAEDYDSLLSKDCRLLIGPAFALLRPEFSAHRKSSLERRKSATLRLLLISMGGVDKDNVTVRVMETLAGTALPDELEIEVILGRCSPHLESVKQQAGRMPWPTQVSIDVSDMASRMSRADLAIGAAGSSSWERCCLGLPSIAVVLAENQGLIAEAVQREGAGMILRDLDDRAEFSRIWSLALDPRWRTETSLRAAEVTDGRGVNSVVRAIEQLAA